MPEPIKIHHLADSALRVELATAAGPATTARIVGLTAALEREQPAGILDLLPSYATLVIAFDPVLTDPFELEQLIHRLVAALPDHPAAVGRQITLPVLYGGELGPDLDGVAAHTGLSPAEVIARHSGTAYLVACLGFAPGFPFLMGLPPELATPRLTSPRTNTPVGSVAIGGEQTGVYPLDTPGGWRVIGRTPVPLFDLAEEDPFLMRAGDTLRFEPVTAAEFAEIEASPEKRGYVRVGGSGASMRGKGASAERGDQREHDVGDGSSISLLEPGLLTTVQDLGRPGLERFGVTRGGAADRGAVILGNQLVRNDPDAAGLEMTLAGPRLRFNQDTVVALTGADLGALLNGSHLPRWQPVLVRSGDELGFGAPAGEGARAYLCVAGGLLVPEVLGSRATDLTGRFGGVAGRPLQAGDELPVGTASAPPETLLRRHLNQPPPDYPSSVALRVVLGPQEHRFTSAGLTAFHSEIFTASTKADRMGVRLTGPEVELSHGADMLSEGIAPGSIQVPGDGQPIALLTPRQTVGGYPKIATIISADLDRLAQVRPGNKITFTAIDAADARKIALAYHDRLGDGAIVIDDEGEMSNQRRHGWDPDGVIRVIEAAQRAGLTALRLEVEGVVLELQRGASGGTPQPQSEAAASPEPGNNADAGIIRASMLGIFYSKPSPDEPPFVAVGDKVEAGQTLGLIEVMKTYNEVTAPVAGTVKELIAQDGAFVEYNEPLLRIAVPPE